MVLVENDQGYNYMGGVDISSVSFVNIDGKTKDTINTLSLGVTERFAPFMILAIGRDIQGATDGPTISIGTNSPNYDNVLAATDLGTGLVATEDCFAKLLGKNSRMPLPGEDLVLWVRSAAGPGGTVAYRFDVLLIGSFAR